MALLQGQAQNPVPNPSFEAWTGGEPDGWYVHGVGSPSPTVIPVTTAFSGNYALKGQTVNFEGNAYTPMISSSSTNGYDGFPVSQQYAFLRFQYIFVRPDQSLSNLVVQVDMLDGDDVVGYGLEVITDTAESYTLMTVPLTYTGMPTECLIFFWIEGVFPWDAPYFILDDVELFGSAMGAPEPGALILDRIHPNPASDRITIELPHDARGNLTIRDAQGRACLERQLNGDAQVIDLNLSRGFYMVIWSTPEGWSTQRLVVE